MLERLLKLFADVHGGEAKTVLLLLVNLFVLLTAYLIVKTVREALILAGGGAEVKSYAAAGQALLLCLAIPWYSAFAAKVNRTKLINWVTLFFVSHLIGFHVLAQFELALGVPFFLWVGVFNLLVIAQFWAFANDIYTREQGERLFALVAVGGSLGAIMGPIIARWLFVPMGPYNLMLVTAALLGTSMLITNVVARERRCDPDPSCQDDDGPLAGSKGGFSLVVAERYLLMIALLMVVLNLVNTTGEFILGKRVTEAAQQAVTAAGPAAAAGNDGSRSAPREQFVQNFIGRFYAEYFFWVNSISAIVQLFLVSRVLKYVGVARALFILPFISLTGYGLIAFYPVLAYIQLAKILENSTDYSLQNTTRQALFLPTSREAKYKAKAAIDSFFVRIGDVFSAAVVFIGTYWHWSTQIFALTNIVLIAAWLVLVVHIGRKYSELAVQLASPGEPAPP